MHRFLIYCDDLQEGMWFKQLNIHFRNSPLEVIPSNPSIIREKGLDSILKYDRPDIILQDNGDSILVLERTVEVPSGHNVGQRYGRLLAAAEARIPVVYFGPYAAYKHGGNTAGPRYMNLRLFASLQKVSDRLNTAVTTINWPVDDRYEILKTPAKDARIAAYLELFFDYYDVHGLNGLTEYMKESAFQVQQTSEQRWFINHSVRSPAQYELPPGSVELLSVDAFTQKYGIVDAFPASVDQIILYHVGMTYMRSDPYTGMTALYKNLYATPSRCLVLDFLHITRAQWYAQRQTGKTYRMFKDFADAIRFKDGFVWQKDL